MAATIRVFLAPAPISLHYASKLSTLISAPAFPNEGASRPVCPRFEMRRLAHFDLFNLARWMRDDRFTLTLSSLLAGERIVWSTTIPAGKSNNFAARLGDLFPEDGELKTSPP